MAAKNDIDITIGGKTFTLSGVESEAYLREVASYLNEKLKNFSDDAAYWKLPNDMRNVMLQLNLADDYFKERSRVEELESKVQGLEEHRDRAMQELAEKGLLAEDPEFRCPVLSMGMTGDFEVAVEEGATMVRVGTAIFGKRNYHEDGGNTK